MSEKRKHIPAAPKEGTVRSELSVGTHVAIVMKADQTKGTLTEGYIRNILTDAPKHPYGIKVRLETGEVGRVKKVFHKS